MSTTQTTSSGTPRSFLPRRKNADLRNTHRTVSIRALQCRETEIPRRDRLEGDFLQHRAVADVAKAGLIEVNRPRLAVGAGFEAIGVDHARGISGRGRKVGESADLKFAAH